MKKPIIEKHITQGPTHVRSGEKLIGKRFVQTGSVYGRFIFVDRPPMVEIAPGAIDVAISHCDFLCLGESITISGKVVLPF